MDNVKIIMCLTTAVLLSAAAYADDAERDVPAVQKFLNEKYPNATWGRGPTRLSNQAIEAAYSKSQFFYVFSPQYPVAREDHVSAVVQIDGEGTLRLVEKPPDYDHGLMKIRNAEDAKAAAAAIMSLMLGPMGPSEVSVNDVEASLSGQGWAARVSQPQGRWDITFDGNGHCATASYKHTGPLPICIGGLFRVVSAPPETIVGKQRAGVGLLVDSVDAVSIAQRAGLLQGDLVVCFDGQPLPSDDTIQKLRQTVYALKQQHGVHRSLTVLRGEQIVNMRLTW